MEIKKSELKALQEFTLNLIDMIEIYSVALYAEISDVDVVDKNINKSIQNAERLRYELGNLFNFNNLESKDIDSYIENVRSMNHIASKYAGKYLDCKEELDSLYSLDDTSNNVEIEVFEDIKTCKNNALELSLFISNL